MKIFLLTKYSKLGASCRLRSFQYVSRLEKAGHQVSIQSLFDDHYLMNLYSSGSRSRVRSIKLYLKRFFGLWRCFTHDVVWIQYELFPYFPAFFERLLSFLGVKMVVDYDDAIYHNYDLSGRWIVRKLLGGKIDCVMRLSKHTIVGNHYLAARARAAGARNITIIPTVIDLARYSVRGKEEVEGLVIGWIGSPSTQKYLIDICDSIVSACKTTNSRLLVVGATPDIVDYFPGIQIDVHPWTEETEVQLIGQMDVGVMPLRDGPWEKGKCGYKLIQYMACGVPVLASPVGINNDIVFLSESGFLVGSKDDWEMRLTQLLTSGSERRYYGGNGRRSVEKVYSLQAQSPILRHILETESARFD